MTSKLSGSPRSLARRAALLPIPRPGRRSARSQGRHPRRRGRRHDQPPPLRPLRRAPGPLHLRRHLGRRRLEHPQHPRHPQRHRRGPQGDQHPESPLARRLLCRRLPLARRHRPARRAAPTHQHALGPGRRRPTPSARTSFSTCASCSAAEPYIAGNVGSGTPQEMRDWIEYMTFDGDSELANLRRKNGRDKPWKIHVLRRRQRELGLRRQHAARVLRRPVSAATPRSAATSAATGSSASPAAPAASTRTGPAS